MPVSFPFLLHQVRFIIIPCSSCHQHFSNLHTCNCCYFFTLLNVLVLCVWLRFDSFVTTLERRFWFLMYIDFSFFLSLLQFFVLFSCVFYTSNDFYLTTKSFSLFLRLNTSLYSFRLIFLMDVF